MPAPHEVSEPPSKLKVAGVVVFYIVAALMMVTVNKWVLLATPAPLFLLFYQLLLAVLLLLLCQSLKLVSLPSFDTRVARQLWKLIAINVVGLTFNTFCLQYVDASFYQIARGLVLPITVGLALATGQAPPSGRALFCCVIVTVGFLVGVLLDGSMHRQAHRPSPIGVFFGVASSCTTAVHSLVIKSSLSVVNDSAMSLAWYTNLLSMCVLLLLIPFEMRSVIAMMEDSSQFGTFIIGGAVTGVFGFLICIAGFISIKVTSPVTHMVSAAARGVIQTCLGVWFFSDILTRQRTSSIFIVTLGSCAYVWVKNAEQTAAKNANPAADSAHAYELAPRDSEEDLDAELARKSMDRNRNNV